MEENQPIIQEVPQQASPEAVDIPEEIVEEEVVKKEPYLMQIPLEQLIPHREQGTGIRDEKKFNKLVENIEAHGLNQPILVKPFEDKHEIVAGQNRWEAVKKIGKSDTIEAIVKLMGDDESAERALTDNIHRQDLTSYWLECCIAKRYENGNYTYQKLGEILDISDTWVRENIKAYTIRKKLAEKTNDYFTDFSTSAILDANKIITDFGRGFDDLVTFMEKAKKKHYSTNGIKKMIKDMKEWSDEAWSDFFYEHKSFGKVNKDEKDKREQGLNQQEVPIVETNKNNIISFYQKLDKNLEPYIESLDCEEEAESIRHIKLSIVLLCESLLKQKYITAVHFKQIADDILNCTINPHDYDGTSDLEQPGISYTENLEIQSTEETNQEGQ